LQGSATCAVDVISNGSAGIFELTHYRLYTGWTDYEFGKWRKTSVGQHIDQFQQQISILLSLPDNELPIHVNCHSGCDTFSEDEATEFFAIVSQMQLKISISHETHRGRILGSPWMCLRIIEKFKDLRITLDISHWNVVSERLIPIDILKPVLDRVDHIHARIGTHESPQVGYPRAEYAKIFREYHELVWKTVWQIGMAKAKTQFTVTPEYGPVQDFYMPHINLPGIDGLMQQHVEVELTKLIFDEQNKVKELFDGCQI
jgi:hypothetical protein